MSSVVDPSDTPRSSLQSNPPSTSTAPAWKQPKTPIPPHRLAKLANALGVSTPIPASLNLPSGASFLSRSFSESSGPPEHLGRSPTPSAASSVGFSQSGPSISKFLLHVVPPTHLPHDSDAIHDSDMTPPPASASGYHTQFRRGTLVPVHPTLQGQLGAIAKEYALPSTAGLVLYLVNSGTASGLQSPVSPGTKSPMLDDDTHEPGPRLSDEIWRHLWARVVQAEQRDGNMLNSRSPTPLTLSAYSTPFLTHEYGSNLRPPHSPGALSPISPRPSYQMGATPSPPSSISDLRSNTKSAPPSSATQSEFDPNTPDTSINDHGMRADSLDLPGLNSPSLIPILAKVEFDIDKRRAAWYEPWLRSRRVNHAKRTRSRKSSAVTVDSEAANEAKEKVPAIPLLIGRKETASPFGTDSPDPSKDLAAETDEAGSQLSGYEQLSDTQEGDSDSDDDMDDFTEDTTARVSSIVEKKDPLEDVFGSDADTWNEMKAGRRGTHEFNPNVVNLSLTAGELAESPIDDENDVSRFTTREEEEVRELLDRMSQSGSTTPDLHATFSSPETISKRIPPPLVLVPGTGPQNVVAAEPSPFASSTHLAYLDSPENNSDLDAVHDYRSKSPADSEKRSGALFEDLDLGLDPTEDFDDPNDRRKSQIVMSAQLDEIERTLAQLSPRFLKTDLEDEMNQSFQSMSTLSPNSPAKLTLSPLRPSDAASPPSRLPSDPPGGPSAGASWPAIPFAQIKDTPNTTKDPNRPPSPPQLTLNGVTTGAPRSYNPRASNGDVSSETVQRKKELEEEQAFFRKPSTASPVIPLSPDPFGRFSSSTPEPPPTISEPDGWDTTTVGRASISLGDGEKNARDSLQSRMGRARSGTTSRFSIDSVVEEGGPAVVAATPAAKSNRGTLMSVKSIKNLWRKSNKGDKAEKGNPSGRVSPGTPMRPERPSQETMDLPDMPPMPSNASFGRISPQPPVDMGNRRPSQESTRSMSRAPSSQGHRPSLDRPNYSSPEVPPPRMSNDAAPPMMAPGLSVPPYAKVTRNNTSPIIPSQMLSNRPGAGLVGLHFDQESPYPNPVRTAPPPARYAQQGPPSPSPSMTSPTLPTHVLQQQQQMQMQQQQGNGQFLPSIPEQEKLARKSILKWKSTSSNGSHHFPPSQEQHPQRMSFDRASNASGRTSGSGGSYHGHGQGRGSVSMGNGNGVHGGRKASVHSFSSDLAPPPSPNPMMGQFQQQQQHQYQHHGGAPFNPSSSYESGGPLRSRTPVSPNEFGTSPPMAYHRPGLGAMGGGGPRSVSPAASFASSHASIDESQFEIVSPRMDGGFSYPTANYHSGNVGSAA